MAAPRNRAGLVLELRAQGAAHVALSAIRGPSDDMYRVVFERSRVWIAKGKHGQYIEGIFYPNIYLKVELTDR